MLSTDFYFNGVKSTDLGVYLVKLSTDFTKTPFLFEKEIIEESITGRDKPYFYGINKKPLTLKLVLSCVDGYWTYEKRRELARWLCTDNYELFYSTDNIEKWYYCQYVGGIDLSINSILQGYIEVEMRCDSPYAYSPIFTKDIDLSNVETPVVFEFENLGDVDLKPEMWITAIDTNIKIENLTYANIPPFEFNDILNNETIYIDNENEIIETDLSDTYRYDNFNDNYLILKRGVNRLQITGKCKLSFRWQYKILG